jgi:hypothetical protein
MQYLLSRASRAILARLAQQRTLCAFDFDGTLSPIVEHPAQAGMREQTRILLDRVAALYPCVIISCRPRSSFLRAWIYGFLGPTPPIKRRRAPNVRLHSKPSCTGAIPGVHRAPLLEAGRPRRLQALGRSGHTVKCVRIWLT